MVRTLKPLAFFLLTSSLAPVTLFSQTSNCSPDNTAMHHVQAAEEKSIKLKNIIFTGNTVLPVAEQEKISAFLSKATFKTLKDVSDELKALVRQEWQHHGYFKVEVGEPEIKRDADDRSLFTAIVWIEAGKQYRLGELRIVKNTVFPSEKLRSLFPLQTGDVFDTYKVGKGIEEVRKLYGEMGYINISVVPTTEQQDEDNRVHLRLEMDEGSQFRVGKVEVLGADETKRQQITTGSGLITGGIYNSSRLQKVFASREADGSEAMEDSVTRTIHEADSTVDVKVDLRPCVVMSQK